MTLAEAQADLRHAHGNGAVGIAVSGLVWLVAGLATLTVDATTGMITLFFGGMAIHPLSQLIDQRVLRLGNPSKDNGLEVLGLLTVPIMLAGLFAGYLVSGDNPSWFFSITLMAIGSRYLTFYTLYGLKHYIALGLTLLVVGFSTILWLPLGAAYVAMIGGTIELFAAPLVYKAAAKPA
jgi:hypothetical protein